MTFSRKIWLLTLLVALALVAAPGTVLAQGYGPDPFRPYNSQYDPYRYPIGPARPSAGGQGVFLPRMGNFGANQYQGYMDELDGMGRQGAERYGIGIPYYRSAVNDTKGTRQYRPNGNADRDLDETRELITRKYLAYFAEKDPKKRAQLLQDYNETRRRVSRAMSAQRESSSRMLDAAMGTRAGRARSTSGRTADDRAEMTKDALNAASAPAGSQPSAATSRGTGTRAIPPPPPLSRSGSARRTTPRRTPAEVLERANRVERGNEVRPNTGAATGTESTKDRRPAPLPPDE